MNSKIRNKNHLTIQPFNHSASAFTLLELLVVVAILGLLAAVGMGQYRTSQIKARDGQRKSDLANIARALEMYYNDYGSYPADNDDGNIVVDGTARLWGASFESDDAVYMKVLPRDPQAGASDDADWDYCYMSDGANEFMLFARLENENDDDYQVPAFSYTDCGTIDYTYVITSSNAAKPTVTP